MGAQDLESNKPCRSACCHIRHPFLLLELIYFHYTEYNPVETPEFKAVINPLEKTLHSLVETDEEADKYMNIVFELCCAYERQAYVEGIKLGTRLTMELMELPPHQ